MPERREWVAALVGAVTGTVSAVAVNVATDEPGNAGAWIVVVLCTVVSFVLALCVPTRSADASPPSSGAPVNSVSGSTVGVLVQVGFVRIGAPRWSTILLLVTAVLLACGALAVVTGATTSAPPGPTGPPAPTPQASDPSADQRVLENWPTFQANRAVDLPYGDTAGTTFVSTTRYLRSAEVAAAPAGARVLIRITGPDGRELVTGETSVSADARAKVYFDVPRDLGLYRGDKLQMRVTSLSAGVRIFVSRENIDDRVTALLPCGEELCSVPDRDLSALVIGRDASW